MAKVDFHLIDAGSLVGFYPLTAEARDWFNNSVTSDGWQWMGNICYVENRYAGDLYAGIVSEGFAVTALG